MTILRNETIYWVYVGNDNGFISKKIHLIGAYGEETKRETSHHIEGEKK